MITTGSKLYYALGAAALLMLGRFFLVFEWSEWPIGLLADMYAFGIPIATALAIGAISIGAMTTATRDADADEIARAMGAERAADVLPPASRSGWPVVAGFAIGLGLVGIAISEYLVYASLILLFAVAVEWMVVSWADRTHRDPAVAAQNRNRIMLPVEIPGAAAAVAALLVIGISRVFLAMPSANASSWTALALFGLGIVVFFGLWGVKTWGKNLVAGLLLMFGVAVVAGGIVSAAIGTREIEAHHDEHGAEHGESEKSEEHGDEGSPADGDAGHDDETDHAAAG